MFPLLLAGAAVLALLALKGGAKGEGGAEGGAPQLPAGATPMGPGAPSPWDKNLTAAQQLAIRTALAVENDPNKLDALADNFAAGGFPIAAAALHARATQLRLMALANQPPAGMPQIPSGVLFEPAPPAPGAPPGIPPLPLPLPTYPPLGPILDSVLTPPLGVPASFPIPAATGTPAIVTTKDTGPSGRLRVRATPSATGAENGRLAHLAPLLVKGPSVNGYLPIQGIGEQTMGWSAARLASGETGPLGPVEGWGVASAITPQVAAPGIVPAFDPAVLLSPAVFAPGPSAPAGTPAKVTTNDTGDLGRLKVRSAPVVSNDGAGNAKNLVGKFAHGAAIFVTGPAQNGFLPVSGVGEQTTNDTIRGQQGPISGWSGQGSITLMPQGYTAGFSGNDVRVSVVTNGGNLGLRAQPDSDSPMIAQAPNGSTFRAIGPARNGYVPLADDAGRVAWGSEMFLGPAGATLHTAGFHQGGAYARTDVGAGPSIPFAELNTAALALKTALATNGCRSYNEPLVKRFQRAANACGLYEGPPDGWYGTVTQAALGKLVGNPAPACFPEAKGGPSNPNEYWSPIGA